MAETAIGLDIPDNPAWITLDNLRGTFDLPVEELRDALPENVQLVGDAERRQSSSKGSIKKFVNRSSWRPYRGLRVIFPVLRSPMATFEIPAVHDPVALIRERLLQSGYRIFRKYDSLPGAGIGDGGWWWMMPSVGGREYLRKRSLAWGILLPRPAGTNEVFFAVI